MWFCASLLFESVHEPVAKAAPIWEERIVLLESIDATSARHIAELLGHAEVVSYKNDAGEQVTWRFDCVLAIYEIGSERPENKSEVFCRFLKDREVQGLKEPFDD
jgi:hypothetical protein